MTIDSSTEINYPYTSFEIKNSEELLRHEAMKSFRFNFDESKKNHQTIIGFLRANKLYEPDVSGFLKRILRSGDHAVDVGANIGFHTMLMASLVGESGCIEAFEPSYENILEIQANQDSNQFNNIKIHQKVLGQYPDETLQYVFNPSDSGTSFVSNGNDSSGLDVRPMKAATLDEALVGAKLIKVIKMDVEGSELAILKGSNRLLKEGIVKYWIVEYCQSELNRMGESLNTLRDYMAGYGLEMFVLDYSGGFPKHFPRGVFTYGKYLQNLLFADINQLGSDWVADDITFLVSAQES
jgi:FkbM family methyltransferase